MKIVKCECFSGRLEVVESVFSSILFCDIDRINNHRTYVTTLWLSKT